MNADVPSLLCQLSAPGIGLCHYFGQDYAIIPGWDGLRDYPNWDYAIIGLRGVVLEGSCRSGYNALRGKATLYLQCCARVPQRFMSSNQVHDQ